MLSEEDASLDLCLKQWADEATGELRSVLLFASARIRALAAENEALRRERGNIATIAKDLADRGYSGDAIAAACGRTAGEGGEADEGAGAVCEKRDTRQS